MFSNKNFNNTEENQDSEVGTQSPVSPEYATPPEHSESNNIKTASSEDLRKQKDDANLDETLFRSNESLVSSPFDNNILSESGNTKVVSDNGFIQQGSYIDSDTSDIEKDLELEGNEYEDSYQSRGASPSSNEDLDADGISKLNGENLHKDDNTKATPDSTKFANFSKGEKALLLFVALSSVTFAASFVSSVLGKPLCPDKKGNLISLAILGTVTAILVTISLVHFHYPNKSKKNSPSSELNYNEMEVLEQESKKNI